MNRGTAIVVTLVVYKIVLLALGFWGQRRTKDTADYYLGGRQLGPLVASISAAASSSSAWTILGVSGAAYSWGLGAVWLFPACVGGFFINWYILAPGVRRMTDRTGALTALELLAGPKDSRLHREIRTIASIIVLFSLGAYVCSQLQAAGKTFASTFPELGFESSVLIGGGIVVFYTLLGGFWAVSLTDTLQGLLMAATAITLPIAALVEVGGFGALSDGIAVVDSSSFASLTREWAGPAAIGFILGVLGIGLAYPGQPHVVNRLMALGGGDEALRAARRIAMVWAVVTYAGMILLGLCGRVLWTTLADNETVFVAATNQLFHPVIAGVMIAAVLSAIMSTADSQLLVAGSTVTHDLGLGSGDDRTTLMISRITVFCLSLCALLAAIWTDASIFGRVLFAFGAMGAAFGPILLCAALTGRLPSAEFRLASMMIGCGTAIGPYYLVENDSQKVFERVLPIVIAGVLAWMGVRANRPTPG